MHFQVIRDDYYNNLIEDLFELVPEFQSKSIYNEDDEIYPVLGEFGFFIIDNIEDEVISTKSFKFINRALELGKYETENVIVIQVFHLIFEECFLISESMKYLSSKAKLVFLDSKEKYDQTINQSDNDIL